MAAVADYRRDRAFERLYALHVRDVYRYVLAVLRNPTEAEDVTQTTFLNAYRAMLAGEEPQKPQNWLIAIAHNACRSRLRFAKRRPTEVPLDVVVEQLEVPEAEGANVGELFRALGDLPVNQRAAITMRELEGRSHSEIAETLGVTVPAAEALIGRARRALRAQAYAIRGLVFVQVPHSLRNLIRPGEAAGGAAGSAAIAKAVAILAAAGVVAGGAGLVAKSDSGGAGPSLSQPLELRVQVVTPGTHHARARAVHTALRAPVTRAARHEAIRYHATAGGRAPRIDTSGDAVTEAPAPRTAPTAGAADATQSSVVPAPPHLGAGQTASSATPAPVTQTVATAKATVARAAEPVHQAVSDVVSTVTTAVSPPPAVPSAPALPQPPAPPVTIP